MPTDPSTSAICAKRAVNPRVSAIICGAPASDPSRLSRIKTTVLSSSAPVAPSGGLQQLRILAASALSSVWVIAAPSCPVRLPMEAVDCEVWAGFC